VNIFLIHCRLCGVAFHGKASKKSELRKRAAAVGWAVAVPVWALRTDLPPVSTSRRTCDVCPDCAKTKAIDAIRRMESLRNESRRKPN